ncbi:dipeptidase PepV [Desmospora profundinema]|uniref:Succinyl-diaminopimelate desuccinylase n=1 Tax=Desmospora profundinema TaxID=1571184 RepID=A0ABU1IRC5_9BACL|nr:dipeptidase PepV [Desmospora profundinema]MDR6227344.1 succinyl-diaminopimelate desuccinylase [Desmospora profundinema]
MRFDWQAEMEKRRESLIHHLTQLCAIESIRDESTAREGAPFGEAIATALDYMLDLGKTDGFETKNVDGYAGHIQYGEGEELVGVLAHLDVVPAGDGWTSPPFSPEIRDGKFYARGAQDDKGPAMAAYFALKLVKESGLPLSRRVRLILGTDEESQWKDMKVYFEREQMPDMGFTPDADFPLIHAEKGLIDLTLSGSAPQVETSGDSWVLSRFEAGQRPNMVPDAAGARLAGDGDVFELKERYQDYLLTHRIRGYAEEADDYLTLVMEGVSHHGSEPDQGLNAAYHLAEFLGDLPLDEVGSRYVAFIRNYLVDSFFGEKLGIAQSDDITGPLTVNGGVFRYEPGEGQWAQLNIRYPVDGDHDWICRQVDERVTSYGLTVTEVDHKAPNHVDPDHPLVKTLLRVYEEQTGQPAKPMAIGGATYARALKPGVCFGPLFPGHEERAHQKDEYIRVDDLIRAAAIYAQAIYELAK